MRGFYVMALLAIAGLTVASGTATAGLPSQATSLVEDVVIATLDGSPPYDAPGTFGTSVLGDGFVVEVKDVGGAPVGGATVTITFMGSGFNPYNTAIAPTTVTCATKTTSQVASALGVATFKTLGGGWENNDTIIQVSANGVPLKTVKARSCDLEPFPGGDGDVDIFDQLEFFKRRFPTGGALFNSEECDYDLDTNVTIFDQLLFFQQRFKGILRTPCP